MDLYNLTDTQYKTQVFYQTGIWYKPRGISMVHITCLGAGGGGASTAAVTSGTASYGGGGGGSGALTQLTIPSIFVSDVLKVTVAQGGIGGTNGSGGANATATQVDMVSGDGLASTLLCYANGGNGGNAGSAAATGAGGAGGSAAAATGAYLLNGGIFFSQAGIAGGNSNTAAVASNSTNVGFRTPSTGGGGKDLANTGYSGGTVLSGLYVPQILGGAAGGFSGGTGFFNLSPLGFSGGAGGGGNGAGTGGQGGDGGIGGGGGGGGAGTASSTGGRGGNGLVIINCW